MFYGDYFYAGAFLLINLISFKLTEKSLLFFPLQLSIALQTRMASRNAS